MNLGKHANASSYRTVWITGASGAVGYALARQLAKARNYVFVSARNERRLTSLAEAFPENICAIPADVADEQAFFNAFQLLKERTDHLDTLVVVAERFEYSSRLGETQSADRLMRVNYQGAINTIHLALPLLKRSGNAPHIIVLGSLLTQLPFPQVAAYAASKRAIEHYVQSFTAELNKNGIDVSIVRPWFLERKNVTGPSLVTRLPLMKRYVQAQQVVEHILVAMQTRAERVSFPHRYSWLTRVIRFMPKLLRRSYVQKYHKPNVI